MISKNISINIKKDKKVPFKETYIIVHHSRQKFDLNQKYINSKKNQKIELNFEECGRLMNLLFHYVFKEKFRYSKDKMIIYKEENK